MHSTLVLARVLRTRVSSTNGMQMNAIEWLQYQALVSTVITASQILHHYRESKSLSIELFLSVFWDLGAFFCSHCFFCTFFPKYHNAVDCFYLVDRSLTVVGQNTVIMVCSWMLAAVCVYVALSVEGTVLRLFCFQSCGLLTKCADLISYMKQVESIWMHHECTLSQSSCKSVV